MNELIQLPSVVIGEITDVDDNGAPRVRWQNAEPTSAQVVWMPSAPMWKHCIGARVILGFVDGDERRPIVLGLLDAPKVALQKPEVLHIESGRELVIECGEAKISLPFLANDQHGGPINFENAEAASQYLITEQSICTVPWDDAGPFLRFSATYEAETDRGMPKMPSVVM